MIRILRAFAWMRWRLLVNGLRGRRRDSFEQVSRISRVFVVAVVGLSIVPTALVLAALAFAGAVGIAHGSIRAALLLQVARVVLTIVTIVVALVPLLRFGGGATSTTRLALLPIPRRLLFAIQMAAQAADPWILAILPALVAVPAGFVAGGSGGAAAWSLLAAGLVLLFLAALGSAASLAAALLFRNRRIGEIVTIAVFVAITVLAYVPMTLQHVDHAKARVAGSERPRSLADVRAMKWFPSELYVVAVRRAALPAAPSPALPLLGLAGAGAVVSGAAFLAFSRLLDAPGDRRTRGTRADARIARLPGLSSAASAVALATFRLVMRSVRGRLIVFTAPLPVLMMGFLWRKGSVFASVPAGQVAGPALLAVGGFIALLSFGQILADQFAVDRAGLTLAFLSPAGERDLLLGKAAGTVLASGIPVGTALVVALVMKPGGSPFLWIAALAVSGAVFAVQAPVAAILAAAFPAPYDLMKLRAGNPHPLASLVTMAATLIGFGVAAGAVGLAYALTRSGLLALAVAAAGLAVACGVAALALPLAARILRSRRENLAMVAQGR